MLSDELFEVQVSEEGAVIELGEIENKPITGELELTKKDISDGKLLPNAGFRIKDADGNVVTEGYTDENGIARFTLRNGNTPTRNSLRRMDTSLIPHPTSLRTPRTVRS